VLTPDEASSELGYVLDVRAERVPADQLTPQALALVSVRGLSAYDATCLALALGTDSILVTADRRLAAEAERSALLPERGPT
jgi:predicted nucleic acid-binding protein